MTDVSDMNLAKLIQHYSEDAHCRELLKEIRWPEGVTCPRCSHDEVYEIRQRNQYQCKNCEYRFSGTAGTIPYKAIRSTPEGLTTKCSFRTV